MYRLIQRRRVVAIGAMILAVSLGVLLGLASRNPAAAATSTTTFITNGDFGDVDWADATSHGFLAVQRNGSQSTPNTFLFYIVIQDIPCCSVETGGGLIPNGDLTGSATSHLSLNTNTCSDSGFTTNRGPCGVIAIDIQQNDFSTFRRSGNSETEFGPATYIGSGDSVGTSATASGSVIGSNVASGDASMGTFHNAVIDIDFQ